MAVGVGVGVGVEVDVDVGVGVAVAVGVGVCVAVGVGAGVGVCVAVAVGVGATAGEGAARAMAGSAVSDAGAEPPKHALPNAASAVIAIVRIADSRGMAVNLGSLILEGYVRGWRAIRAGLRLAAQAPSP